MTDENTGRDAVRRLPGGTGDQGAAGAEQGGGRAGRATVLLGGGLAVVLLAAVGATAGWVLAEPADDPPAGPPVAAVTDVTTPAGNRPTTARPTTGRTTSPPAPDDTPAGLTVPPLIGTDFVAARAELRDRKLGWRLVFGTGSGRTVQGTEPAAGTPVRRGTTVRVHVAGPAPAVTVPSLVGEDCDDAADDLGEAGLFPRYRTGRDGTVVDQEPAAGATAYWNDPVALTCGDEVPATSGAPATP
ncbi:PASTA domain-containing protein [Micromonospora psammae]|uniref:PASTA domain-containing protein n=1 Tax=Micromonospora sp. CPCC 205556 TaxID=3122398 RepID=UPI002FF37B60